MLRVDPRTLNRFLCHPDPKKRLASFKIGNTVRFERQKLLEYFRTTGKLMDISGNRP